MKIYTKKGDRGMSDCGDGRRRLKSDPVFEALGDVDELNASLGLARSRTKDKNIADILRGVQNDLHIISSGLSCTDRKHRITEERVAEMEKIIDRLDGEMKSLKKFILPGGSETGSLLHMSRTVCRRAERRLVSSGKATPETLKYMNRLSDLLFVLARHENRETEESPEY